MITQETFARVLQVDREIREYREALAKMNPVPYESPGFKEKVSGGGTDGGGQIIAYVNRKTDTEKRLEAAIEERVALKREVLIAIQSLERPLVKAVMTARYVSLKPVHQIADEMGYTSQYISLLLQRGRRECIRAQKE